MTIGLTPGSAAGRLGAAADRLLARVGHWTQVRWAQPASGDGALRPVLPTRADLVFDLVQHLADLCAEAEGRDPRPVPRLENELALVDQVRVMVLDLVIAPAPDEGLDRATEAINTTLASL